MAHRRTQVLINTPLEPVGMPVLSEVLLTCSPDSWDDPQPEPLLKLGLDEAARAAATSCLHSTENSLNSCRNAASIQTPRRSWPAPGRRSSHKCAETYLRRKISVIKTQSKQLLSLQLRTSRVLQSTATCDSAEGVRTFAISMSCT